MSLDRARVPAKSSRRIRPTVEPDITAEEVALAGATYEADYGLEGATLHQCADEISLVVEAIFNGCADGLVATALMGIAGRMKMAARIADAAP